MAAVRNHAKAGGRKAGVPNKVTQEIRELAQTYSEEAIRTAAAIMRDKKSPAASRVAAISLILDRAHGKPAQAVHMSGAIATSDMSEKSDEELRQFIADGVKLLGLGEIKH